MAIRTAFVSALAVTCGVAVTVLLAGFLGRVTIDLPSILEVRSGAAGEFQVELWVNLLAPLVLVVVLSIVIWLVGRAVRA
jgi:hypothetical protein